MHGINLDLLRATAAHHPDGRPKDPHARHRAEHLEVLRSARKARFLAVLAGWTAHIRAPQAKPVPVILCPDVSHGGPGM
jgi:hypothetical protein